MPRVPRRDAGSARGGARYPSGVHVDAKLWWLGVSVPTVVVWETVGIVTAAGFVVLVGARALEHWLAVRG